ncbi:hypothetical protein J7T55_011104 [Diaporthe amygdali]|uniref:uncharacterized protein n=1 Tax=Phomopsis amygdali TaxID=1214568 RepID=UPI0022FE7BA1|nr:uncharacterized protein J7T55_011104 [Diaporthe amygdali]KAJ0107009.1 hypothetical protein J7T55_011104 [Diaporthe amygdali]
MIGTGTAPGAPSSPDHSDSEGEFDLFNDDADSASTDRKQQLRDRADQARRAKLAELPPFSERTCAQNRAAYILTPVRRLQPTILANIFSVQDCELVLNSVADYVQRQGGLQTDRHERFATTDVPVSELTQHFGDGDASVIVKKTVSDVTQGWVSERILTRMASAAGFRPQDLGLQDLFVVCYAGSEEATATRKRVDVSVYPIPSKQASLSLHSDGCLLSFSLLLNHHDAFKGGGTFFKGSGKTFRVKQGGLLMHDAGLEHAGAGITKGQMIILVGFVETVDVLKNKQRWQKESILQRQGRRIPNE